MANIGYVGLGTMGGQMANRFLEKGHALVMKIATNLSLPVQMLALTEGVLLAEKSGIKREVALEGLLNSVAGSPMLQYRGPFLTKMPEEAWFNVNMMQK